MTADTENLMLEHLRHIRPRVDQITDTGDETAARQQITIDRLAARVERIERRLELSESPRGTDHA
ncbi:MAG TPA: hypothetical protein P5032_13945 [Candidatus Competibacter sp.]|nr:hypothetical protein [Candidatus Competibacteraceae bacterium]HRW66817.1 hypothetical protein [Candidatus Competibacter sp.]